MLKESVFKKYPQLHTLKGLIPDEVVEEEIGKNCEEYEKELFLAQQTIKTVTLNKIFPEEIEKSGIYLENFLGHWGNISIEEVCKICLIVKYLKPSKILEIGTYNGMTTLQMALNAPKDSTIFTLNLPENTEANFKLLNIDYYVSNYLRKHFNTEIGSYFKDRQDVNIVQLYGDSSLFDFDKLGCKFDLIFIDAGHDYSNVKCDTENAFRLINNNGIIMWHNYFDILCPDVTKYLREISTKCKIYHLKGTLLAVYINN